MTDLLALAERVEKATGHTRGLDGDIALALRLVPPWATKRPSPERQPELFSDGAPGTRARTWLPPKFTSSLDAAMTLVPEGWNWMAGCRNQPKARAYVNNGELHFEGAAARRNPRQQWHEVVAATPALALTAACLRARAAQIPSPPPSIGTEVNEKG